MGTHAFQVRNVVLSVAFSDRRLPSVALISIGPPSSVPRVDRELLRGLIPADQLDLSFAVVAGLLAC